MQLVLFNPKAFIFHRFTFRTKGLRNATKTKHSHISIMLSFTFRTKGLRNATKEDFDWEYASECFTFRTKGLRNATCNIHFNSIRTTVSHLEQRD